MKIRSVRTPLLRSLVRAFRLAHIANQPHSPSASELAAMNQGNNLSRRSFIRRTSMASIALGLGGVTTLFSSASCKKDKLNQSRKIIIVGGGMAGLRAAYQLKKAGWYSTIFEASERTGGRMYSTKNLMGDGYTTELGGEFIDTIHEDMLELADEFGLELIDTLAPSELALTKDLFFFNNQRYSLTQVIEAFQPIANQITSDINSLPDSITYQTPGTALSFDNKTISEYLTGIGATGWIKSLIEIAYISEYGLEADQQSAINFLYLFSPDTSNGKFEIYGESDERYKIKGGNQQIVDKLADEVAEQINKGHRLEALRLNTSGDYTLTFNVGGSTVEHTAEFVIMTIPFTLLREIDLSQAGFSALKMQAINQLGYGTNAKLMLGVNNRVWREQGYGGYLFTDLSMIQGGWDNTQLQTGSGGGYTIYLGGTRGVEVGNGTPESQIQALLPQLEQAWAGISNSFNNKVGRFHWPSYAYSKGSYACYKPGQITTFGGAEQETAGNVFFAGEHCSLDYQGYMNGAAVTGREAAENILAIID